MYWRRLDWTGRLGVLLLAAAGAHLWHTRLGATVSNGPMTYELDGRQYLVVGAGDTLFTFTMLL